VGISLVDPLGPRLQRSIQRINIMTQLQTNTQANAHLPVEMKNTETLSLMRAGGIDQLWKVATAFSRSTIVPKDYQSKPDNCLVAIEMASTVGASALTVMQNLYIVHGKPSWSSQYIISQINACGRFTPLKWKINKTGKKVKSVKGEIENVEYIAYATEISTGEITESPVISIEMAISEGWYNKAGSKWQTMPDLMGRYRSASFFGKLYCPEILNGLQTNDEIQDVEYSIIDPEEESKEVIQEEANSQEFSIEGVEAVEQEEKSNSTDEKPELEF
jgi:hypothetical protein